jgi:hypothetical protein
MSSNRLELKIPSEALDKDKVLEAFLVSRASMISSGSKEVKDSNHPLATYLMSLRNSLVGKEVDNKEEVNKQLREGKIS